jgi:hypothetical protein
MLLVCFGLPSLIIGRTQAEGVGEYSVRKIRGHEKEEIR